VQDQIACFILAVDPPRMPALDSRIRLGRGDRAGIVRPPGAQDEAATSREDGLRASGDAAAGPLSG
jgi:hypothetical protein